MKKVKKKDTPRPADVKEWIRRLEAAHGDARQALEFSSPLELLVALILAAQTTGGSLGSMLAPAKIIVGCSTAGLSGEEGQVLRKTITYGVIIAAVIGIVVWIAAR